MIKQFKFLTSAKSLTPQRHWGGNNVRTIVYDTNGTYIIKINETLTENENRLRYDNPIIVNLTFRWTRNYNHREILGENYRTNSLVYEGTIDRFMETYNNRREVTRHITIPAVPVIERIEYEGSCFYQDTVRFSNGNMWVKIIYKKFYERV